VGLGRFLLQKNHPNPRRGAAGKSNRTLGPPDIFHSFPANSQSNQLTQANLKVSKELRTELCVKTSGIMSVIVSMVEAKLIELGHADTRPQL